MKADLYKNSINLKNYVSKILGVGDILLRNGAQDKRRENEMPKKPIIDKEMFKRSVLYNVKTLYRKTLEEATEQQIFQAVAFAVKDNIVDHWLKTQEAYDEKDPKTVYYMSMEFLMGRALGNNMINLMAYKEFSEALEELGLDINVIEDQEPDAALGNGGLGRLAACFLDSLATLGCFMNSRRAPSLRGGAGARYSTLSMTTSAAATDTFPSATSWMARVTGFSSIFWSASSAVWAICRARRATTFTSRYRLGTLAVSLFIAG